MDRNPSSLAKRTYREPAFKSFPQKEWYGSHRWPICRTTGEEYCTWGGRARLGSLVNVVETHLANTSSEGGFFSIVLD